MELEKISKEPEEPDPTGEGTSGAQGKTQDEAERDIYSSLQSPSEDVYVDTHLLSRPSKAKSGLWRKVCFFLGAMCVILIVIIIIIQSIKHKNEASVPPIVAPAALCSDCLCSDAWVKTGQSDYLFSTCRKSWDESKAFCKQQGGSLAVITDATEQKFLMQKKGISYWIGLRLRNQVWTWVDSQTLGTNSFWFDSDAGAGDCAVLNTKTPNNKSWSKSDCTQLRYYICQKL